MTREESARILMELGTNYPDTDKGKSREAMSAKVNLWASMFAEEPFALVQAAVRAYIANSTERFAPNIGQIKEQIRKLTHPDELTEGEAWALVQKAMQNSAYNAAEEFSRLPPLVRKVIGSASNLRAYAMMGEAEALTVFSSNFQRGYRTAQSREAAMEKTPLAIRQMFAGLTAKMPEALPDPAGIPPKDRFERECTARLEGIENMRKAAGVVVITEKSKAAAIEKLRTYGKEDT